MGNTSTKVEMEKNSPPPPPGTFMVNWEHFCSDIENQIGKPDPNGNFHWDFETTTDMREQTISFRGSDKQQVQAEYEKFLATLQPENIILLQPMMQFDNDQYCCMVSLRVPSNYIHKK